MCELGLIVSDLDGTLLGKYSAILPENAAALWRASEKGVHVAIASGRLAGVCSRIARDMGLKNCHILGLNGAHVLARPFGETLSLHPYPDALRAKCLAMLEELGCAYNLYTRDGVYTNQPLDEEGRARFRRHFERSGCEVVFAQSPARASEGAPCMKLMVKRMGEEAAYRRAEETLRAMPEVELTTSGPHNFEAMLCGVGKAQAVRELAARLNVPMERVMACGDYDNDVEMLRCCGLSTAMGNAAQDAKDAARFVTRTNEEAGVGWAVNAALDGAWERLKK